MTSQFVIRDTQPQEHQALGDLMVDVYAHLVGFPSPEEQPAYYRMLANIGSFTSKPGVRVLVAVNHAAELLGGIVYFGDMSQYGSGGSATQEASAAGIRLLGVGSEHRGSGAGKALAQACIRLAQEAGHSQVILHTTQAMKIAWGLYERLGFKRSMDLDFEQVGLPVYGFRLKLQDA